MVPHGKKKKKQVIFLNIFLSSLSKNYCYQKNHLAIRWFGQKKNPKNWKPKVSETKINSADESKGNL